MTSRLTLSVSVVALTAMFIAFSSASPANAAALQVYPGCAVPSVTPNHIWYIDPVNGSANGDGSSAKPWISLQAVFTAVGSASPLLSTVPYYHRQSSGAWGTVANPNAPIKPGDAIMLMSGSYGDISINTYGLEIANSDFITVEPAPGQTPIISSLFVGATNKWYFKNLKIQSLASGYSPLVRISGQSSSLPAQDIILDGLDISSQDDVSAWTQADWIAQARNQGLGVGAEPSAESCISVENSAIHNVRFGVALAGNQTLFTNNTLNYIGDDMIDYAASNLIITHNTLTNSLILGDGNHQDFMQGQIGQKIVGVASNNYSNILIDSNILIRQTDPNLKFPGYIQGIDAFDEDWTNVTVTNNVIITSSCWGIGIGSLHGGLIANNTVLDDNSKTGTVNSSGQTICTPGITEGQSTHEGSPSNNVTVRNNIANGLSINNTYPNMVLSNNICVLNNGKCTVLFYADGNPVWNMDLAGHVYGDGNLVDQYGAPSEFVNYDPSQFIYDIALRSGAPAVGNGSSLDPAAAPVINTVAMPVSAPTVSYNTPVNSPTVINDGAVAARNNFETANKWQAKSAFGLTRHQGQSLIGEVNSQK